LAPGFTETTLAKFFYKVPPDADMPVGVQPVGSPLPQTQGLVLNKDGQPCGIGESGEIVIRTPFRSLGYVNAPEEQRKRFIPNPFRQDSQDLVYFTGDVGRYRPDGSLDILGRLDDQVKIRGVRIELGELTAALLEHPSVKSGIVIARKDERQEYHLVAYAVPASQGEIAASDLRKHFAERFPAAMIPSAYVFLNALPINSNGKVNRNDLPLPAAIPSDEDRGALRPRDAVEARLLSIWRKLLKAEKIGVSRTTSLPWAGTRCLQCACLPRSRRSLGSIFP
jgi:acyl-coenzyme A synthetase/AMP-(fatty) acid ligase